MSQTSSVPPAPAEEAEFIGAVGRRLDELLTGYHDRAAAISDSATPLVEAIAGLVRGGKRMRAVLAWWGWRGTGAPADDGRILDAAVALELFQSAALIHDDILDRSDTRRGDPSIHRSFESRHRRSGWRQDPAHFGLSAAVLTGDLCLSLSEEVFAAAAEASANPAGARALFNEMRFEVMAGQYLDVLDEVEVPGHDPAAALERARTVLRFKSARYSVVHPLGLGGVLAGADEHVLEHYERLSSPLGEAFQLQDDLLGVFGDPAVTGKPAGDDLREGKRTALVAHALDLLTGDQVDRLEAALGDPDLGPEAVAQIQRLLESSGARARVERDVAELGEASLAALAQAPMHEDARSGLDRLARRILGQGR
ncbi:polyprenyl synthetase family protein [Citricoccus sp. I39-566]|uniref:polyprenyl synthetase family protein n=1 Tax=Citricoccus sp. I39-566 TaxID=3073268 RepID=UPI00286C1A46|nr:polyprenyl synthetase family protein [Citricoccus sp. I39-566]WMY77629.1 polyprenyl synthetase family protein [Citricoccus sp. I39-566]